MSLVQDISQDIQKPVVVFLFFFFTNIFSLSTATHLRLMHSMLGSNGEGPPKAYTWGHHLPTSPVNISRHHGGGNIDLAQQADFYTTPQSLHTSPGAGGRTLHRSYGGGGGGGQYSNGGPFGPTGSGPGARNHPMNLFTHALMNDQERDQRARLLGGEINPLFHQGPWRPPCPPPSCPTEEPTQPTDDWLWCPSLRFGQANSWNRRRSIN